MMANEALPLKSLRMIKNHTRCQGNLIALTQKAQALHSGPWEIFLSALPPQKLNLEHTLNGSRVMVGQANPLKSLKIIHNHVRYQEKLMLVTGKSLVLQSSL